MPNKNELRQQIRKKRLQLPPTEQVSAAKNAAQHLLDSLLFKNNHHIALYLSVNGELNTQPFLKAITQTKKECYLPILNGSLHNQLRYGKYQAGDNLVANEFGILEPEANPETLIQLTELDLVLVPLVAFDQSGNRLGMGKGYYDRTFAYRLHNVCKPFLLGLAYEFQKVNKIDAAEWDVKLDGVVTEKQLTIFSGEN